MVTTKTNSKIQASETPLRDLMPARLNNRPQAGTPRATPNKLLSIMTGLMGLMVDGLAPGEKTQRRTYELIVVGAGPAGTAAAICAASEGIDTLLIEAAPADGGAQSIECINNCAANPRGIVLGNLAESGQDQGQHFLLDLRPGLAVTGISALGSNWLVETNLVRGLAARSVVLTPGLRRRRLRVPGEERLTGAGIHTCADCQGPKYAGHDLLVVGAGNSGIEQALSLANFAKSVTVVGEDARVRCGRDLYQMAKIHPKITIKLNRAIREFKGGRKLSSVLVEDARSGEIEELHAAAAFITTGLEPATSAFRSAVDVDRNGFIKTDLNMQTKLPGVFAAGHASSRNLQSPEDAAGDGYKAAVMARKYLERTSP